MAQNYLFVILLALFVATLAAVLAEVIFSLLEVKKRRLQERLGSSVESHYESMYGPIALAERRADLTGALARSQTVQAFHGKLARAYPGVVLKRFMFMIIGFAAMAAAMAFIGTRSIVAAIFAGLSCGMLPFLIVSSKCARQQRVVEDQLPEALDFLARVLRAGHSLSTGMQMAAEEIPEPLATQFRRCYDSHSLGTPIETSMKEMAERVGTPDFSFFVTAVLIQRTTGGDLAEVLTNIGNMVRARIRLQQHVKAITAEGRLVGYILLVLPVIFYIALYLLNPKYARVLIDTREGFYVLLGALVLQMLGLISIKKIVSVKM
ncbi:MAG: tight adherence protein [Phycisphaerales bacterium]|jgi:tight adherence protein B|nr:tight adherence protein [Phycisphaerales bacterium]